MEKKSGSTIVKIVAFIAGIVAIATACFVFRDKIKEFFKKIDLAGKFDAVKEFITGKFGADKQDDYFDDAEFFDEDDIIEEDTANRGYTSINFTTDEAVSDETEDDIVVEDESSEEATEEDIEATEDVPEAYENEGLSDVSEDEDVLEEEAALDGAF